MIQDNDIIYFTKRERRNIFVLIIILILMWWLRKVIVTRNIQYPSFSYEQYQIEINDYLLSHERRESRKVEVTPFSVNKVSATELVEMGIRESTAQTWIKYREAINGFKNNSDLKKIYGIDTNWINAHQGDLIFDQIDEPRYDLHTKLREDPFNPNTVKLISLEQWGFSDKAIKQLRAFRDKGGLITRPEDLKFLFGMDDGFYESIKDKIQLPSIHHRHKESAISVSSTLANNSEPENKEDFQVDVNKATEYEWQMLSGIGPYYAGKIVRFRDALGGFSSIEQIADTYGLPDSVFQKIKPQLIPSSILSPLLINQSKSKELAAHPYLNYKQASILVNYRDQHGPFLDPDDLYEVRIFDSVQVRRIAPYLSFALSVGDAASQE